MVCAKVLSNRHEKVIVFEDDVRFGPFFHERFSKMLQEVAATGLDWDLMYVHALLIHVNVSVDFFCV